MGEQGKKEIARREKRGSEKTEQGRKYGVNRDSKT